MVERLSYAATSIADCRAIAAWVGAAAKHAGARIDGDAMRMAGHLCDARVTVNGSGDPYSTTINLVVLR